MNTHKLDKTQKRKILKDLKISLLLQRYGYLNYSLSVIEINVNFEAI